MKKSITLLLILVSIQFIVMGQSARMLLAESFTSTTCGPCALQNPPFDALLSANVEKITSIKYHMSWPSPGNDPMYLHNPIDNNARRTYYNVNSVPHVYLSGNYFNGVPSAITQASINSFASNPSPLSISMQHRLSAQQDSVYVSMLIYATAAVNGTLVAHIAVIEKEVRFTVAPGTNGEKDFYNVMKAMIPTRTGTVLPNFEVGDYVIVEAGWKLQNVYSINQIAAVGFVQNNANKHVHQSANSSTNPIVPYYANDAAIKRIDNVTALNCSGSMRPKAVITNFGSNQLTSCEVNFSVNGQTIKTVPWSGSLGFLQSATIDPGTLNFGLAASNTLQVHITSVNGGTDGYIKNNIRSVPFSASSNVNGSPISLFIMLNAKPEQTTWELLNSSGTVIQSGGPYTTPSTTVIVPLNIPTLGCYEFVMYDAAGDGLCCNDGSGYYAVLKDGSTSLFTGQSFGFSDRNQFAYGYVGLTEQNEKLKLNIHPNPTSRDATISIELGAQSELTMEIIDLTGRQISHFQLGTVAAGKHELTQYIHQLNKGIYFVSLKSSHSTTVKKIVIQ